MNAIGPKQSYQNLLGAHYIHLEESENVLYKKMISCMKVQVGCAIACTGLKFSHKLGPNNDFRYIPGSFLYQYIECL